MYGPKRPFLLRYESRNTRHKFVRRLTGSQRTPGFWGFTAWYQSMVYKYLELSADKLGIQLPRA